MPAFSLIQAKSKIWAIHLLQIGLFGVPATMSVATVYETGSKAATARQKSTTRKTVRLWVRRAAEEVGHAGVIRACWPMLRVTAGKATLIIKPSPQMSDDE